MRIIDKNCKNMYDFLYLPMDQESHCNMGYGYVNMVDLDAVCVLYENVRILYPSHVVQQLSVAPHAQREGLQDLLWTTAEWIGRSCNDDPV